MIENEDKALKYYVNSNTADVARVLKDIAIKYTTADDPTKLPRVLQFTSEDRMTKYEICQTLAEIAGLPIDHIIPNDTNDPNSTGQSQP